MTEKRFELQEDYDWWGITDNTLPKTEFGYREDLPDNYMSSDYKWNDLTHNEVVDLLNEQDQEIKELKRMLQLVSEAETVRDENSVKEIVRDNLFGLDTVAGESVNAYNDYLILNKFFKEYYNGEYWDNDKFD